jgi:hypothetical protein
MSEATKTLIENLKKQLAERKSLLSDHEYKFAIFSIVDEKIKFDKNHLSPAILSVFPFDVKFNENIITE